MRLSLLLTALTASVSLALSNSFESRSLFIPSNAETSAAPALAARGDLTERAAACTTGSKRGCRLLRLCRDKNCNRALASGSADAEGKDYEVSTIDPLVPGVVLYLRVEHVPPGPWKAWKVEGPNTKCQLWGEGNPNDAANGFWSPWRNSPVSLMVHGWPGWATDTAEQYYNELDNNFKNVWWIKCETVSSSQVDLRRKHH